MCQVACCRLRDVVHRRGGKGHPVRTAPAVCDVLILVAGGDDVAHEPSAMQRARLVPCGAAERSFLGRHAVFRPWS